MKPPILAAILALLTAGLAQAQNSVQLTWDRNPEPDILGYRVYQKVTTPAPAPPAGTPPPATPLEPVVTWTLIGTVPVTLTPATPIFTVKDLPFGAVNAWAVTAFNPWGESYRCREVKYKVPISPPVNLKATGATP